MLKGSLIQSAVIWMLRMLIWVNKFTTIVSLKFQAKVFFPELRYQSVWHTPTFMPGRRGAVWSDMHPSEVGV